MINFMKHIGLTVRSPFCAMVLCALMIILANCTQKQGIRSSFKETVEEQTRINRYFHRHVIPKLRTCWSRVQGAGTVTIFHRYAKDGKGNWVPARLGVHESTLRQGQEQVALACMQEATKATSFPVGKIERQENEFVLYWRWPVPLPADTPKEAALFWGQGGGKGTGCDGEGQPPECSNCSARKNLDCQTVCVGYSCCESETDEDGNLTFCSKSGACASGGRFGTVGVLIQ